MDENGPIGDFLQELEGNGMNPDKVQLDNQFEPDSAMDDGNPDDHNLDHGNYEDGQGDMENDNHQDGGLDSAGVDSAGGDDAGGDGGDESPTIKCPCDIGFQTLNPDRTGSHRKARKQWGGAENGVSAPSERVIQGATGGRSARVKLVHGRQATALPLC